MAWDSQVQKDVIGYARYVTDRTLELAVCSCLAPCHISDTFFHYVCILLFCLLWFCLLNTSRVLPLPISPSSANIYLKWDLPPTKYTKLWLSFHGFKLIFLWGFIRNQPNISSKILHLPIPLEQNFSTLLQLFNVDFLAAGLFFFIQLAL